MKKNGLNTPLYCLRHSAYIAFCTFFSTTVMHSFLLAQGLNYFHLGVIGTVENVVNVLTLFLMSGQSDILHFRTYKRTIVIFMGVLLLRGMGVAALAGLSTGLGSDALFVLYLFLTVVYTAGYTFFTMVDISLVVRITQNGSSTSRLTGIAGLAGGVISILTGLLIDFFGTSVIATSLMGICSAAIAISATLLLQEKRAPERKAEQRVSPLCMFKRMLALPSFRKLVPSNLFRGLQFSTAYYVASAGITRFSGENMMGTLALAASFAPLVGYVLLTVLSSVRPHRMYLTGCCIAAGSFFLLLVAQQPDLFAAAYFLLYVGQSLIDICYPLGMYEFVPVDVLGAFSAMRMLLYMASATASTYLYGLLMDNGCIAIVFILGIITAIASGWSFFRALNKTDKAVRACAAQ